MTFSLRRTGVAVSIASVLAFAAAGCGGSAASTASTATQQQAGQPPGGGPDLSALASKLGVSETKLEQAMQAARPTQGSSPQDMTAALAKALGVSEAKVQAAMQATRPSGTPPQVSAPQAQAS